MCVFPDGRQATVGQDSVRNFERFLILYLEDNGFRPWPNLPTGPRWSTLYTNMQRWIEEGEE